MTGNKSSAIIYIFLSFCFMAIIGASLWQRFLHPSLTVHPVAPAGMTGAKKAEDNLLGKLMEAAAASPKDRVILGQLVEVLMNKRQWPAAEHFAQRLLALDAPGNEAPEALFWLAVINHNQGRHAQAAELFEKLLARKEDPSARFSLGILYFHFLGRHEEGLQQLEKALAQPNLPPGLAEAIRQELAECNAFLQSGNTNKNVGQTQKPRQGEEENPVEISNSSGANE